eukprot:gene22534-29661_t
MSLDSRNGGGAAAKSPPALQHALCVCTSGALPFDVGGENSTAAPPDSLLAHWFRWLRPSWLERGNHVVLKGDDGQTDSLCRDLFNQQWKAEEESKPDTGSMPSKSTIISVTNTVLPVVNRWPVHENENSSSTECFSIQESFVSVARGVETCIVSCENLTGLEGDSQLRASYMGHDLPVVIKSEGQRSGDKKTPVNKMRRVSCSINLSGLPEYMLRDYPDLVFLEVWNGDLMTQQVPLLLLPTGHTVLASELAAIRYDSITCRLTATPLHAAKLTVLLGLWMRYVSGRYSLNGPQHKTSGEAAIAEEVQEVQDDTAVAIVATITAQYDTSAEGITTAATAEVDDAAASKDQDDARFQLELMQTMNRIGCFLLDHAVFEGWSNLADQITKRLAVERFTWWNKFFFGHAALEADTTGKFVNVLIKTFPDALKTWYRAEDKRGITPAALASSLGCEVAKNRKPFNSSPGRSPGSSRRVPLSQSCPSSRASPSPQAAIHRLPSGPIPSHYAPPCPGGYSMVHCFSTGSGAPMSAASARPVLSGRLSLERAHSGSRLGSSHSTECGFTSPGAGSGFRTSLSSPFNTSALGAGSPRTSPLFSRKLVTAGSQDSAGSPPHKSAAATFLRASSLSTQPSAESFDALYMYDIPENEGVNQFRAAPVQIPRGANRA